MVRLESFEVCLDRFDRRYSAGEPVTGSVYVSVASRHQVKVKELSVTLIGEAKTSWVNKISDNIYDSTEPYLNLKQTFRQILDEVSDDKGQVPAGQHRFPFKFSLPVALPSSYEGEFGSIRYTCLAEISVIGGGMQRANSLRIGFSSKNKKIAVERPIIITAQVGISDLSPNDKSDNGLRKECCFEAAGCCGVRAGRINAALAIPRSAFLVGQSIPVEVWLQNQTRRSIRGQAVVSLVQEVHFHSVSFFQTASDTKIVSRVVESADVIVPQRGTEMTNTALIRIPPDLPATTLNVSLISVRYKVRVDVGHVDLVLPIGLASKA